MDKHLLLGDVCTKANMETRNSADTFARLKNSDSIYRYRPPLLAPLILACYCFCLVNILLLALSSSSVIFVAAQGVTRTPTISGLNLNEQYSSNPTNNQNVPQVISTTTTTSTSITVKPTTGNSTSSQQQQPKSLKFTLIAGKLWRFNIKANSFFSYKEGELRLHKNVSTNNYIIDDDGWFQYNPQQQQLFAWPSLTIRPGTYHYVLLPSGIDFEADSENLLSVDVVANIVVELIRPLYQGAKGDVDLLIDHKFSLDFLHRHQAYPLLLQQIVSVFDTLVRSNTSLQQNALTTANTSTPTTSTATISAVLAQQKNPKLANKLSDYLLISSTYSSDGEFFSITWSSHPALSSNNTITLISECRLATINDTVTKLSSLSSGYRSEQEKFVIYYPLDAPLVNSQAIVPTERGNNALKLILNSACQQENIVGELGSVSSYSLNRYGLTSSDLDDKQNFVAEPKAILSVGGANVATNQDSAASKATEPGSDSLSSSILVTSFNNSAPTTPVVQSTPITTTMEPLFTTTPAMDSAFTSFGLSPTPENHTQSSSTAAVKVDEAALEAQVVKSEETRLMQQSSQQPTTKMQPQAKSLANFLDSNDVVPKNFSMTSSTTPSTVKNFSEADNNLSVSVVPAKYTNSSTEASLNEELIGILDDIMNYIVSVAIPIAIIIGVILLVSTLIALCSLYIKKKKSKQLKVRNRFDFRYGSERRGFLKNSSEPVILEADQKSISLGGTPQHRANNATKQKRDNRKDYQPVFATSVFGAGNDGAGSTECGG